MNGRIAIDRRIMDWEWWGDMNVFRLWMVILMLANWQDKKWQGKTIKRGSFVTSYASLSETSGLTLQQTRTAINKLKSTGEIEQIVTNKYQVIIVVNYEKYQENFGNANNQITDNQQSNNNQITINQQQLNKDNKGNKGNKEIKEGRFTPPTLSEVQAYIEEKGYHVDADSFIDFYASKGWMVGKNKMKDWKAAVRTWEKRNVGNSKERMGQTFNRGTEQQSRGVSGATDRSGSGDQRGRVTFPKVAYGFEEEA